MAVQSTVVLHRYIPWEAGAAYPDAGSIFVWYKVPLIHTTTDTHLQ